MPMGTKLDRVVTYHEGIPPIKSRDPLITWSCEITRQTKTITNSTTRLAVGSYQKRHMNVLSRGLAKLRDKLKPLYVHYQSAFGHQTWQNCNLP